jgi:TetR/AcrR family transcriptional regulator
VAEQQSTPLSRREDILQALARMLESSTNGRITTAALAREVGFSEAALYRHFPSKAKMYEALLAFAEDALFSAINLVTAIKEPAPLTCGKILLVALTFAERNPGITRMLCGDALHGEKDRLKTRAGQIFLRLDSELKQVIRLSEVRDHINPSLPPGMATTLMVNVVEGKLHQYVRSHFQQLPTAHWDQHWQVIGSGLFPQVPG